MYTKTSSTSEISLVAASWFLWEKTNTGKNLPKKRDENVHFVNLRFATEQLDSSAGALL